MEGVINLVVISKVSRPSKFIKVQVIWTKYLKMQMMKRRMENKS